MGSNLLDSTPWVTVAPHASGILARSRIRFEMPSIQTILWPVLFSLAIGISRVALGRIFVPIGSPHHHWWWRTPWPERLTSIWSPTLLVSTLTGRQSCFRRSGPRRKRSMPLFVRMCRESSLKPSTPPCSKDPKRGERLTLRAALGTSGMSLRPTFKIHPSSPILVMTFQHDPISKGLGSWPSLLTR